MNVKKLVWLLVFLLVAGGLVWLVKTPGRPGKLDLFATCIKDSGAKYYGAFWCPNCKNQEARFGKSARLLPRIECSTPDAKGQMPICQEAKVEGYPTWDFVNGERVTGNLPLERLAELTSCILPQE
ncbi:MAG: thioredoxin domain-containing protein [bacterium]|nr:thioredoxin domain-containing protein [bacterium]